MTYCCCCPWEGAITLIGMMQLNAALYFWAQFSTMDWYYFIVHLVAALVFTFRVVAFFMWLADDSSSTRSMYYNWHSYSAIVLGLAGIGNVVLEWQEWGHIPTWTVVLWLIVFGLNVYHIFTLSDFAASNVTLAAAEVIPSSDSQILLRK